MQGLVCEQDGWSTSGFKITSAENLDAIKSVLENEAPIIVEHWFYRKSSSPERRVFDDFEDFMSYLHQNARAGDMIKAWSFSQTCTESNMLAHGKCPDDQNRVPEKGSY